MELANHTKIYRVSGHLTYSCQYHVVFCAKYRRKVLDEEVMARLKQLIEEKQADLNYRIINLNIYQDHVHMIVEISPEFSVADVTTKIKRFTSHVLRNEYAKVRTKIPTLWTRISFISSVGNIDTQDLDEFLELQKKN